LSKLLIYSAINLPRHKKHSAWHSRKFNLDIIHTFLPRFRLV